MASEAPQFRVFVPIPCVLSGVEAAAVGQEVAAQGSGSD